MSASCVRLCGRPSWNGQPGEHCSRWCRDLSSAPEAIASRIESVCQRPGCNRPAINGAHHEFCSYACCDAAQQHAGDLSCTLASNTEFNDVHAQITQKWRGPPPQISAIYKVVRMRKAIYKNYFRKCQQIGDVPLYNQGRNPANQQRRFHGTSSLCNFQGSACNISGCVCCSILRDGFDIRKLGTNTANSGYFGAGHYSTSLSSTAAGYGLHRRQGARARRVLFVVNVAAGVPQIVSTQTRTPLPAGCHSRIAQKSNGVDELMVPGDDQMLPLFLVTFV